jgi:hypothetical protein
VCYLKSGDQQGEMFFYAVYGCVLLRVQSSQMLECNFKFCLNAEVKNTSMKLKTAVQEKGENRKFSPSTSTSIKQGKFSIECSLSSS